MINGLNAAQINAVGGGFTLPKVDVDFKDWRIYAASGASALVNLCIPGFGIENAVVNFLVRFPLLTASYFAAFKGIDWAADKGKDYLYSFIGNQTPEKKAKQGGEL